MLFFIKNSKCYDVLERVLYNGVLSGVSLSFSTVIRKSRFIITTDKSDVYWLNLTHYDGEFMVPKSWFLSFLNINDEWQKLESLEKHTLILDCYNTMQFTLFTTCVRRINVLLDEEVSGGVLELKVY